MKLLFLATVCLFFSSIVLAQSGGVKISGRVYANYSVTQTASSKERSGQKYLSDFKVVLIRTYDLVTDRQFLQDNKKKICQNDNQLFQTYKPKVSYTDRNGMFEFTGLQRDSNYIIIFCDQTIQISIIPTGNRLNVNYKLKDKKITI